MQEGKEQNIADSEGPRTCVNSLKKLAISIIRELSSAVSESPEVAVQALPLLLLKRERALQIRLSSGNQQSQFFDAKLLSRSADLLYRILLMHGLLRRRRQAVADIRTAETFLDRFDAVSQQAIILSVLATNAGRREVAILIKDSVLHVETLSRNGLLEEWKCNRDELQRMNPTTNLNPDNIWTQEALLAQTTFLGFNGEEVFLLLKKLISKYSEDQTEAAGIEASDGLLYLDTTVLDDSALKIISSLRQTPERLERVEIPFHFDLGREYSGTQDAIDLIANGLRHNWGIHYPFLEFGQDSRGHEWVATSIGTLVSCLTNLETARSTLLDRIVREMQRKHLKGSATVEALARKSNRQLEDAALAIARNCDFKATRLGSFAGAALECGEIDGLLARPFSSTEILLVVCEVKDTDVGAHKDDFYLSQERKFEDASRQLRAKATWVAKNWHSGLGKELFGFEVGKLRYGQILKLVVSRDYVHPSFLEDVWGVPIYALAHFLQEIAHGVPGFLTKVRAVGRL
jgi:hypothetical protein